MYRNLAIMAEQKYSLSWLHFQHKSKYKDDNKDNNCTANNRIKCSFYNDIMRGNDVNKGI